ncbi:exopolysaccharide biosynthesis protein [Sphingomonas rubra]|nr:exopolysaccharide biosynthesis protein [Sphingomonas rubra]
MADDPQSVTDILDKLDELADEKDKVTFGDAVEAFGNRSYGPFLLVPALIEMSPIGGIPGLPTVLAAIIALFAVQMVFGRKHLWLPTFLQKRGARAEKVRKATKKLRGVANWTDRWFHGRLPALTSGPFVRVAAVACILLAATVPPLELLPFASTAPMAAIAAFGLALLVRDGLLMIVATALAGVAVAVGIGMIGQH